MHSCLLRSMFFAAALATGTAVAVPIPASQFIFDVLQGGSVLTGCTGASGSSNGGTCGSETSGAGFAATSGGIGTQSYLPVTAGGTVLGTGTAVDASSTWTSGRSVGSIASMTYSFEATGPSGVDFIPIDVFSKGVESVAGDSLAYLSLVIRDSGTDANIPLGVSDPDLSRPLLDLSAYCADGSCVSDWGTSGQELLSKLCVVNGDNYTVTITAATGAGRGAGTDSAAATLDPVIKLDPPYPMNCSAGVNVSDLGLETGAGASTGVVVSEPGALGLALVAVLGLPLLRRRRPR